MKKILFAALTVLLLTAVCVVGLLPALSNDGAEGVLNADMLNAYGATVDANTIKEEIEGQLNLPAPQGAVEIADAAAFAAMESGEDKIYSLTADIDLTKLETAYVSLGTAEAPFSATIYGNGHTVTTSVPLFDVAGTLNVCDLTVSGTVTGNGALANVAKRAELFHVINTVEVIAKKGNAGGLVGTAEYVWIESCYNSGNVTAKAIAGGLVGEAETLGAYGCLNTGSITGGDCAGGLVGSAASLIAKLCVNGATGNVTAAYNAGGIVGEIVSDKEGSSVEIADCANYATVSVTSTSKESAAGGIAGSMEVADMRVTDCSNYGAVSGYGLAVSTVNNGFGGIIGRASGDDSVTHIENCFNNGLISAHYVAENAHYNGAAGILGYDLCGDTTIYDCYNMGVVRAVGGAVNAGMGGILGQTENGADCAEKLLCIEKCINIGAVNGGRAGGILGVGENFTGVALIKDCTNGGEIKSPANYAAGIASRLEPKMAATDDVEYPISFVNCSNSGIITAGGNCAGGICGYATGTASALYFENCSNSGRISNKHAGGILANVAGDAVFEGCSNTGKVYATSGGYSGGIAGNVGGKGTFTDCINKGDIIANSKADDLGALTGGICGRTFGESTFTDCTNDGTVIGGNNHTAGIVGEIDNAASFTRCQNNGNITANINDAAGIMAKAYPGHGTDPHATFTDCVNTGNILSVGRHAGGIAGWAEREGTYTNCVNTGDVKGAINVGGIVGVNSWKPIVTSCINTGYVEGGRQVGGIAGSVCTDGHHNGIFIGCVNLGDVYNNAGQAYHNGNSNDKGNATGGIVGYVWGVADVTHCTVTGNISANYYKDMGEIQNNQPVSALAGYQNNNDGVYTFNTFTGTLNGGAYGKPVLIKSTVGSTICNNTGDKDLVKWNYSVNAYPFFIERHGSTDPLYYYYVAYDASGATTNPSAEEHHALSYSGWNVEAADVSDGTLLATLNGAAGDGVFTQVSFCGGESYPVYTATAALLETWYEGEHVYDQLKTDDAHHWYECECGELAPEGKIAHDYVTLVKDTTDHWYECECGAESEKMPHAFYPCADGAHHWQECYECGYATAKEAHNSVLIWDDTYHGYYCDVCGELLSYEEHSFDQVVPSQTADYYHTTKCACGVYSGEDVLHSFEEFEVTDEGHRMTCACGATSSVEYTAHTVFDPSKIETDGEYHWQLCACGYVMNKEAHYCNTPASCDTKQVCEHCGTEFGEMDKSNHEEDIQWTTTETQHYGWYPCCGFIVDWTDHTFVDGVCTVCEMVCIHDGGTATCLKLAVCQYCNEEYGEVDKTNHDDACSVTWYRNETDHAEYRSHHKGILTCETIVEAEAHDFVNGVCTVCAFDCVAAGCVGDGTETCQQLAKCKYCGLECGVLGDHAFDLTKWAVDDEADKHYHACTVAGCTERADETACSGNEDKATCMVKSACTECGQTYGEFGDHDFDEETFLRVEGAEQHYNPCTREGCTVKGNVANCFGGTANCVDKALCEKCGVAYGTVDASNHKNGGETKFVATVGNENHQHDKRYTCCDALVETTDHAYDAATGKCSDCDHSCTHNETFRYSKTDEKEHSKTCDICGLTVSEDHTETTAATCQAPAFCNLCGESYGEKDPDAHNFSTEWTQIDNYPIETPDINTGVGDLVTGAVHFHACLNGGCGVMKDFGICNGEATCKDPAKCSVCDGEHGSVASEHTGLSDAWEHETVEGVTYHYHPCAHCGEKDQDRAACAGTAATCISKAKCSTCDTEFGELDEANHALATQSWKVDAEHNQHYKVWDCCGVEVEASRATHVYPKDGVSYACECGHACDHTVSGYDYTNDTENGNHVKTCKDCGYAVSEDHTFSTEWKHATGISGDVTHYHDCVCGAQNDVGACTFDVEATCQAAAKCSVCGRVDDVNGVDPNGHVWGDFVKVDDFTHKRTCTLENCGTDEAAADHAFGEDTVCDSCGYTCTHETTKGWSDWAFADDAQHQRTCLNCGYIEKADHTETTAADCVNKATCAVCNSEYGNVSDEHDFDLDAWVNTDAEGHWYKCKVAGCEVKKDFVAHTYDRYDKNETTHWLVCVCGHVKGGEGQPEAHNMQYRFDENGHWQECVCEMTTASEPVDHHFEVVSDANGHWEQCICGATTGGDPIKHVFSAETGICTEAGCGYACTHSGKLTYVADAELTTAHDVFCNECGKKIVENGVHSFDLMNPHYICEGNYHWIACLCGAKFDAVNGAMEHSKGAEGDLEATCKTKAYCSICGSEYGEVDPDNHATPDTFDYWTDPDDLGRHFKAYDCCGVRITNEAHTFVNGECKYCGADCVHTGGKANCKDKAICKICGVAYGELATTHVYSNACDTDCNACGVTRETSHTFGDWVEVLAPTTSAKGKETRTCTVCGAVETYESDMLPAEEKDNTTVIVVAVVSGSVVGVGAIVGIGVWVAKSRAAAKIAAEQKPWRTKPQKKKKWKKRK